MKIAILYLGALSPDSFVSSATSRAAQIFQKSFLSALRARADVTVRSYYPVPSFPRGPLFFGRRRDAVAGASLPNINLGALKVLTLGVSAAVELAVWAFKNRDRERVVIAYNLNAPPAFIVRPVARLFGVKCVPFIGDIYVPGEVVRDTWLKRLEFALQRREIALADGRIVCNEAIIDDFAPRSHHVLVEGGVDGSFIDQFDVVRRDDSVFHVVFAGQLSRLNGVDLLLGALNLNNDPRLRVTIVGRGEMEPAVREAAARDDRIKFYGLVPHEEVMELYKGADLLLNLRSTKHATHRYVFPSKVVECLATGVPLLTTATGHVESEFGSFVHVLRDETPEGLAMALRHVPSRELGREAQEYVRRNKTWSAQVEKVVGYIEDLERKDGLMRVLAFVDYYMPGFKGGGPMVSVSRMAESMGATTEFFVVTRDRDLGDTDPYRDVRSGVWEQRPEASVLYAPPGALRVLQWVRESKPDVVYLNSFFSPMTRSVLLLRRLGLLRDIGVVLAPRGEFSPGALRLKSVKKRAYIGVCKLLGLTRGITWQASAPLEESEIVQVFDDADCVVQAERPADPSRLERAEKSRGSCRFVFVSRVSRKKHVEFALELLRGVKGQVTFDIYGPVEDSVYGSELQAIIDDLPSNVRAVLHGPIAPVLVPQTMAKSHCFLFPTLGENFGHVIAEALAVGTPCLLSDTTPWTDIDGTGAGRAIPLEDKAAWQEAVQRFVDMDVAESEEAVRAVRSYYESKRRAFLGGTSESLFERAA